MPSTIDALVRLRADHDGGAPMVIDPTSRMSYRELDSTTRDLAATFIEAGVGKGTRVGLVMPNGTRWVQIAIALTRIGAVLVPLSTLLTDKELAAQLQAASVQFLLGVEEFRGHRYLEGLKTMRQTELPALRAVWSVDRLENACASDHARNIVDPMTATVTPADPLVIMFTSGSSGAPKGVIHSHGNALGAVQSGLAARCITSETRLYLPMPFFWVGGFGSGILSVLLAGATLVTEEIPRPETTLRLLEGERVNLFRGWPDQAEALAREAGEIGADLSALQGGSLRARHARRFRHDPNPRTAHAARHLRPHPRGPLHRRRLLPHR
jgi:acyl-CoA synthetase (AMP-forming)/AMP-acid ligase II